MDDLVRLAHHRAARSLGRPHARPPRRARARVVVEADGDWWYVDGYKTMSFLGIQTGDRFDGDPDKLRTSAHVRRRARRRRTTRARTSPRTRPTASGVRSSTRARASCCTAVPEHRGRQRRRWRRYNDWLAEFCSHDPARLKGIAMVNIDDTGRGGRRARAASAASGWPARWSPSRRRRGAPLRDSPARPFWAAAEELDCRSRCTSAPTAATRASATPAFRLDVQERAAVGVRQQGLPGAPGARPTSSFGRARAAPGLRVGTVEHELAWIPFFLDQMDYTYTDRPRARRLAPLRRPRRAAQRLLPPQCFALVPGGRASACACAT